MKDLTDFDRKHLWHPYTSATHPLKTYEVSSTSGVHLELKNGAKLIDGMASWWCAIHGYNHPVLNEAIKLQLDKMAHVMFGGITHEPAVKLAEKLIELTPEPLQHVFLADSGSVSVEVAIKMALQYWQASGQPEKNKLMTVRGGYHGDTFAAMSVCDPETGMHHLFADSVKQQIFAERPTCRFDQPYNTDSINAFEQTLKTHAKETAAVIIEPIVQGAGGMWFYHPDFLRDIRKLCDEHNVLLILDEIATGFGRSGKLFACEWADITPDITCIGKALTGGYMTLAATLATKQIAEGISTNGGVLMHGPTFMGNPLACAVANASIDLLLENNWQQQVSDIEQQLKQHLASAKTINGVNDVRVLGAIGVIEMEQQVDVEKLQTFFVKQGVWIRPFGKLIYIMPPYIMQPKELEKLCKVMVEGAEIAGK